ncbi:hypothetical protein FACS1894111_09650 [Clostridia bacterium]|nr:hypothetical protein FACS1894111_09650 [Clostridia bacterium]
MQHLGTKTLETKRLILRRFTIEDAPLMYQNWASDPEVTKFLMWTTHKNQEESEQILTDWIKKYEQDTWYHWCIVDKENSEPIGSMGAMFLNENYQKIEAVEIGYCISKDYWHKGITSEALAEVMRYLFDEVGVNRMESRHAPENPNSGKVMEKCGLRYEGRRIQGDWNNQGVCDAMLYGLTKAQRAGTAQGNATQNAASGQPNNPSSHNIISDETIEYVGILAKLSLSEEEKEQAKKDMGSMLDYIDQLNSLDTTGVEPMSHVFPIQNVFREDVVTNGDDSKQILQNAPAVKDNSFKVPKTVE